MLRYLINAFLRRFSNLIAVEVEHQPAAPFECAIFALVFVLYTLKAMPVYSISLDGQVAIWKGEIYQPPSYAVFLLILYSAAIKCFSQRPLYICFVPDEHTAFVKAFLGAKQAAAVAFKLGRIQMEGLTADLAGSLDFLCSLGARVATPFNHALLTTKSPTSRTVPRLANVHRFSAGLTRNVNILSSLRAFKPFVKAFRRAKARGIVDYSRRRSLKSVTTRLAGERQRHNKFLPTQDVRHFIRRGRLVSVTSSSGALP